MKQKLKRALFKQDEDGQWTAKLPDSPGLQVMGYGATQREALANLVVLAKAVELAEAELQEAA